LYFVRLLGGQQECQAPIREQYYKTVAQLLLALKQITGLLASRARFG
jgi:hypothetical protein